MTKVLILRSKTSESVRFVTNLTPKSWESNTCHGSLTYCLAPFFHLCIRILKVILKVMTHSMISIGEFALMLSVVLGLLVFHM